MLRSRASFGEKSIQENSVAFQRSLMSLIPIRPESQDYAVEQVTREVKGSG